MKEWKAKNQVMKDKEMIKWTDFGTKKAHDSGKTSSSIDTIGKYLPKKIWIN